MGKLLWNGGGVQFFKNDGTPNAGGTVETYVAGSSTPLATYQDSGLVTPHANPITLDAYGRPPSGQIWFNGNTKTIVTDSLGAVIPAMGGDRLNPDLSGFGSWASKNAGVLTKSANYSVATGDDGKYVLNTGGSWTLSLLDAAAAANSAGDTAPKAPGSAPCARRCRVRRRVSIPDIAITRCWRRKPSSGPTERQFDGTSTKSRAMTPAHHGLVDSSSSGVTP